jgi:uncharacterized PurR-regulated membrane protein YhhQ (DUF165 family)
MIAIYLSAMVIANLTVHWFGPAVTPLNALLLIGLDLSLRDRLQEKYGLYASLGLVLAAGAISYALNPASGQIAIASVCAFLAAGIVDAAAYSKIKGSILTRMNGSNTLSALVDSVVFPTIAFGALMPHIVAMQFAAKVIGGAVFAYLLTRKA